MGSLNLKETELRLGLPGRDDDDEEQEMEGLFSPKKKKIIDNNNKRSFSDSDDHSAAENKQTKNINLNSPQSDNTSSPTAKAQIVGWPPVRSSKNSNSPQATTTTKSDMKGGGIYVKVSMDGAPYLRKIDLKGYKGYNELLKALEDMFNLKFGEYTESEGYKGGCSYTAAYEDGDGDMMLVGDVPWGMFMSSCKRFRIMKASETKGIGCRLLRQTDDVLVWSGDDCNFFL